MGKKKEKDLGNRISPVSSLYRGVTGVAMVADQGQTKREEEGEPRQYVHLFLGAWVVRGGVTGRPEFTPPYWYLAFFSEGFRIFKMQTQINRDIMDVFLRSRVKYLNYFHKCMCL